MSSLALNTALTGLAAASTRLQVASNNIANAQSTQTEAQDGTVTNQPFQPQAVQQISLVTGGTQARVENAPGAPQQVFQPQNPSANAQGIVNEPNVDTANELVQTQIASYDYQANLKVIQMEDHRMQDALNIIT